MYVAKNFSFRGIIMFSGGHLIWISIWVTIVYFLHESLHVKWLSIPWLPMTVIGTAVAFYVGFKNNQAYDRLWEAIVNTSRSWGAAVRGFVSNQFRDQALSDAELKTLKAKLLHRHIAWLYTLRNQLLIPTQWEHVSGNRHSNRSAKFRMKNFGVGLFDDGVIQDVLKNCLLANEYEELIAKTNTATQIIDKQSQDLKALREDNLIDDFRHMELQKLLTDFYTQQGKCERIKKFPLPRQYASMSFVFVGIFIFLMPFAMVSEFHKLGETGAWMSIPFSIIIAWVYLMMELVGDYSENPFEGMGNDVPMLSLCRTIEIDLREMLEEGNIPDPIKPVNNVLM